MQQNRLNWQQFVDPPREVRPLPILHAGIHAPEDLDVQVARGVGGVVINVGGRGPEYLTSAEEWERLRQVIGWAVERGLRIWLYDEYGYPSGNAGSWVLAGHPEYQAEGVEYHEQVRAAGEKLEWELPAGELVWLAALPLDGDAVDLEGAVDLRSHVLARCVYWVAPETAQPQGRWLVTAFVRRFMDTWEFSSMRRRNVNIMNRQALQRFIQVTHERYAAELGPLLGQIEAIFTDEPQLGTVSYWQAPPAPPTLPWSDELSGRFRQRKGYALEQVLPALVRDAGPRTPHIRFDFWDTVSDLVAECYFGQLQDWCHAHGVQATGHLLLEESLVLQTGFSGSLIKDWRRMDLPGIDLLGCRVGETMPAGWGGSYVNKLIGSLSHLYGKAGNMSETYAVSQPDTTEEAVMGVAAWQAVLGVTQLTTYTVSSLFETDAHARFNPVIGRLMLGCTRGTHVADVAVLLPEAALWSQYVPPTLNFSHFREENAGANAIDRAWMEVGETLLAGQRDFDYVTEDLLQGATVTDGRWVIAGERFRVLVLPRTVMLQRQTAEAISRFVEAGGKVVVVGAQPERWTVADSAPAAARWVEALLQATPRPGNGQAVFVEEPGDELLRLLDGWLPADLIWEPHSPEVLYQHRRTADQQIYFLFNKGSMPLSGAATVRAVGSVEVWNPWTGTRAEAVGEVVNGRTQLPLTLGAWQGVFLVFQQ